MCELVGMRYNSLALVSFGQAIMYAVAFLWHRCNLLMDEACTWHADLDTAVSAMSNGSLDLDLMQSKGDPHSSRMGANRQVNWEAF